MAIHTCTTSPLNCGAETILHPPHTRARKQVVSGGENGMGTCLREVGILAFLKIKREEAGFARDRAGFAELASWFYRRSAIGGVDHVCLVFRGGGISLREAMEHRTPTVSSVNGVASKPQTSVWQPHEVVAVARGLLEVGFRCWCVLQCVIFLGLGRFGGGGGFGRVGGLVDFDRALVFPSKC